ncbi:MAG TPA: methyltransferase domain-containing protein [Armatimonadota bacterium]|nr:methyltransferase domain-containing protein [Armatimonadota bacterium]
MTKRNGETELDSKVCPARRAGVLDNRGRKLLQNPDKILAKLVQPGQRVLDIGCGPGFFSLAMARIVGEEGLVIAADLQQEMLDRLRRHARADGLEPRIQLHRCQTDRIGLDETVDFALVFYMIHEVPDTEAFLREMHCILRSGGGLLLVEPKFHVSASSFRSTVDLACAIGFKATAEPRIFLSRSVLLKRD